MGMLADVDRRVLGGGEGTALVVRGDILYRGFDAVLHCCFEVTVPQNDT